MEWLFLILAVGGFIAWRHLGRASAYTAARPGAAALGDASAPISVDRLGLTKELLAGRQAPVDVVFVGDPHGRSAAIAGVTYRRPALNQLMAGSARWTGFGALLPEPTNPHDPFAVQVIAEGLFIGYVPRRLAAVVQPTIAREWDQGHAVVTGLTVFRAGKEGFGGRMQLSETPSFRRTRDSESP